MMLVDLQSHVISAITCTKALKDVYEYFKLKTKFADCVCVKRKLTRGKMILHESKLV